MIFLVPGMIGAFGLWKDRTGLVWLAVGLFLWISWQRKQADRRRSRLFSVPMPPITPSEFGAPTFGDVAPVVPGHGKCGCA